MRLMRDMMVSRRGLPAFMAQGWFWGAFAALVPQIKAGLGAGDGVFGLALLCASVGAVLAMAAAPLVDRRLGAWGVPLSALALAVAFALLALAQGVPAFAVVFFFVGAGSGLLDVLMNARISEVEAREDLSLMGLNHAAFSVAYALSAAATGVARDAGAGAGPVFLVLLVLTLAAAPAMRAAPETAETPSAGGRGALGPVALIAGLITLVAFLTENATEGWSALHIERTLGGNALEGGLGPAVLGLTMAAGRLAGHLLTIRGSEARVIGWAAALSAAGAGGAAGSVHGGAGGVGGVWLVLGSGGGAEAGVLGWVAGRPAAGAVGAAVAPVQAVAYLGFAVVGLGVSVIAPLAIGLGGALARPGRRTATVSRVVLIGFFGFFIGPPLMGFVSEWAGLRAAFAAVAALLMLVPVLLGLLRRVAG